ncbi:MAG: GspE/PulE family protein, partial [Acidimicrobiales bacterium]
MTMPAAELRPGGPGLTDDERLGSLLVENGLLSEEALEQALRSREARRQTLPRILIDDNLVSEADLVATLAALLKLDYVDLSEYPIDAAAARLVSDTLARRYLTLPIGWHEGRLLVAMADPSNGFAIDDIRTVTGAEVRIVVATSATIMSAIAKFHRVDSEAENISAQASSTFEGEHDLSSVREITEESPIVRLVNLLITQAIEDRASDIHIEPGESDLR